MAIGQIGPLSTDANNVNLGGGCWKYFTVVAPGDFLNLAYLGRGNQNRTPWGLQTQGGIVEYINIQKTQAADVIPVSRIIQPASVGATGVPLGGSVAGETGAEVASGRYVQGSVSGNPVIDALLIDCTGAIGNTDVTVIVREDV